MLLNLSNDQGLLLLDVLRAEMERMRVRLAAGPSLNIEDDLALVRRAHELNGLVDVATAAGQTSLIIGQFTHAG